MKTLSQLILFPFVCKNSNLSPSTFLWSMCPISTSPPRKNLKATAWWYLIHGISINRFMSMIHFGTHKKVNPSSLNIKYMGVESKHDQKVKLIELLIWLNIMFSILNSFGRSMFFYTFSLYLLRMIMRHFLCLWQEWNQTHGKSNGKKKQFQCHWKRILWNAYNLVISVKLFDLYEFYTGFSKFATKVSFDFHITKHFYALNRISVDYI